MDTQKPPAKKTSAIVRWLVAQKWLWKKVIFNNGSAGENYHRYDHRIFPYSFGMGDNGKYGDVNTAIKWQLKQFEYDDSAG